jgi:hypothetical protein
MIAYEGEAERRCRIGKVLAIGDGQSDVTVHVFHARCDGRLQVLWEPAYSVVPETDFQQQVKETIPAKKVLGTVERNNIASAYK